MQPSVFIRFGGILAACSLFIACNRPAQGPKQPAEPAEPETMDLVWSDSLSPQEARFFFAQGWTGGFGEPALDDPRGRPLNWHNLSVYLTGSAEDSIMSRVNMPDCIMGEPTIYVHAKVSLEKRSEQNYSIPGAPMKSYAALDILELYSVKFEAEECP